MDRYTRNILIEGFGEDGQQKLKQSKVLVVGAGGLGSPVLFYLAAAGVGTLGIIDYDVVDISNLQRQILHQTTDLGKNKIESAKEKLTALNPEVKVNTYGFKFTTDNAAEIIKEYDFVVDCCDNYTTKFLINDVCVKEQKPYSHGAVLALRGEIMTYIPGYADYRSVFDNPPEEGTVPTSAQVGILGSIAGVIGSIQATEAIKYLTGIGDLILKRILIFDGKTMNFHSLKIKT
ncbi:HesA/MoeB/ThiF family protein [Dysgonomonas sp. ZJ279]|uniref:HesA/MoeB/ThiF family protein n=1 Tax=Dysgonomonas sp. ZJ279 TaxID=2709796 RepID=UPI0013ED017A|nr:HesA/MoeB/ThiF family protein [Dysgonomonas sp. ZJ279]